MDDNEDGFELEIPASFYLNYEEIANDNKLLAVVRLLANNMLNEKPIVHIGQFYKNLSDEDFESLSLRANTEQYEDILLVSEMLAVGEGLNHSQNPEEFTERLNHTIGFLLIEGLRRKGLVKVYHENMSYGDDMGDKMIVEKL